MRSPINSLVTVIALVVLTTCDESVDTTAQIEVEAKLQMAEAFIDAFYSFDPALLEALLASAEDSTASIIYYQGWAQGGNYKIVSRQPCESAASNIVSCLITVEDDPMLALGIDFNVTDRFEISFTDNKITSVETSSDDLQVYFDARDWVFRELPELVDEPCEGIFEDGPSPGDCAQAMAEGYSQFAASDDFPQY